MEKIRQFEESREGKVHPREIVFLFLLTLVWACLYHRVLWNGETFILVDASRLYYPLWDWGARVWGKGLIPLWNPDAGFGTPFLANPETASWYPPLRFIFAVLPTVDAFPLCLLAHHLLSAFGFYFFARGRDLAPPAAFLGALLFAFSIHAISGDSAPVTTLCLAWIPWAFWASDRLFAGRRGSILFLSLGLGFQMAAGFPVFSYLTLLALGVVRLCRPRSWCVPKAGGFLAAIILAVAYNLAWLIPFIELLGHSSASQRLGFQENLPWGALGTWLNPFFLFHPLFSSQTMPFELSCYFIGLPALALVLWGGMSRRLHLLPLGLTVLGVLLCQGGGIGEWGKAWAPLYHWVARSGYWMSLIVFAGAYLASEALNSKLKDAGTAPGLWDWKWVFSGLLIYGFALLCGMPASLPSFWISLGLFMFLSLGKGLGPTIQWMALGGAILFSLYPADQGVSYTTSRDYYLQPPPFNRLMSQSGRIYASYPEIIRFKETSGSNILEAYDRLKGVLAPNWPLIFGKEECFFNNSFVLKEYLYWWFSSVRFSPPTTKKVLDYLNVRYVLGHHTLPGFQILSAGDHPTPLSENKGTLPKWNCVREGVLQSDFVTDLRKAGDKDFSFDRQCFVGDPRWVGSYCGRKVMELSRDPNHVFLSTPGKGRALLVSSEMAYPGWWLRAEKGERPMGTVNDGFRGAVLDDGEDQAEIIYRPATFRLGCFLSLLVCAVWLGMLLNLRPLKI